MARPRDRLAGESGRRVKRGGKGVRALPRHEVLGMDRDGDDLYAVEMILRREGPILFRAAGLPGGTADLPGFLSTGGFSTTAAAVALPRAPVVQQELALPPLGPAETRLAVAAAFEETVNYPPAEICPAWRRRNTGKAWAATVRRGLVEERCRELAAAGLTAARVDLRTAAAATAFWYRYGRDCGDGFAVLAEMRNEESSVIVLRKGEIVFSRALPGLGGGETDRLAEFAAELRATLVVFSTEPGWEAPDCLWVTGPLAARAAAREALAGLLGLAPEACRPAKPAGILRPANVPEPGPEMMVPVGLALAALGLESLGADFLPGLGQPAPAGQPLRTLVLPLGLTAAFLLAGLRFFSGAAAKQTAADQAWLASRRDEIRQLRTAQAETVTLTAGLAALERFGGGPEAYLELLLALDRTLPPGTRIKRLSLSGRQVQTLEGTTPSVTGLMRSLKTSPALRRLSLRGQAVRKAENGRNVEAFVLTGPFGEEERREE